MTATSDHAAGWDPFALLLIDVQQDFWTEAMNVAFPDYADRVAALLQLCRHEAIDVIHLRAKFAEDQSDWMVKYLFRDGIPCIAGTPGEQVFDYAQDIADEKVIVKQAFDGFLNPELATHLAANNKRYLLVAGLVTSVCVLLTAASAAQRGYLVSVVADCCADNPEAHVQTLEHYPFIFGQTTIDRIVAERDGWAAELAQLPVS